MTRKIYVFITGGLGNQMYQYAVGRVVSARVGLPLALDLSWFGHLAGGMPRDYGLGVFDLKATIATPAELQTLTNADSARRFGLGSFDNIVTVAKEPVDQYWPAVHQVNGPAYLFGYWQSPRYFEAQADLVRRDFVFPALPDAAKPLAARISERPNSVVVHIRRGDYITSAVDLRRFGGCCSPQYYRDAIQLLSARLGSLSLFVFSDEPAWARQNFDPQGHDMEVVDFPEHMAAPHHDMHLMTLGHGHIIANSTFSWWGAWLAKSGCVVAPRRWFATHGTATDFGTRDRYPSSWLRV